MKVSDSVRAGNEQNIIRLNGRCEVELKFTVHYSLFGPNSEL